MNDRSAQESKKKSAFLGLYVSPVVKRRIEQAAKAHGLSISEVVRRRLRSPEVPTSGDSDRDSL
jgi:hypothetical protein